MTTPLTPRLSRRTMLAAIGGAGALALVGCGGDDDPQPQAPQPQAQQPAQAQPQPQPQAQQQAQPAPAAIQQAQQQQQAQPAPAPEQQTTAQPQADQTQQAQQTQAARQTQQAAPVARRKLVPDPQCGDCEVEDPAFDPLPDARVDFGVLDGAGYRLEVPDEWNGALVLWGHGFTGLNDSGDGFTNRLTFEMPEREIFLSQGYAWATSTYRAPGYVPGLGVDDLLALKDHFAETVRRPRQTFVAGGSMGGATAQLMAQEFPEEITAAVALCGALGNVAVADFLAAWHTAAHWFIGAPPTTTDALSLIEWAEPLGAFDSDGQLTLSPAGEQFAAVVQQLSGGPRWAFDDGFAQQWPIAFALGTTVWPDLIAGANLTPGETIDLPDQTVPLDSTATVFGAPPEAGVDTDRLNAEAIRLRSDPARRADPGVGLPTGQLKKPLLTIKGTGDLFTPISLDADYQRAVRDAGDEGNLVMRAVRRAGHCNFSLPELLGTLTAIVGWIDFGLKPQGEDLTGDLVSAGVNFTNPFDDADPLRPA